MTCKDCIHSGVCYKENDYENFPEKCGDFISERPQGDLISRSALIEDFKSRLVDCNDWIENAKDKETKIRASAVKTFIAEVIMTIDNAPTVEDRTREVLSLQETIRKLTKERPQGEWIDTGDMQEYWAEEYQCSICGAKDHRHNYCPNCGAQMKGRAKNETDN